MTGNRRSSSTHPPLYVHSMSLFSCRTCPLFFISTNARTLRCTRLLAHIGLSNLRKHSPGEFETACETQRAAGADLSDHRGALLNQFVHRGRAMGLGEAFAVGEFRGADVGRGVGRAFSYLYGCRSARARYSDHNGKPSTESTEVVPPRRCRSLNAWTSASVGEREPVACAGPSVTQWTRMLMSPGAITPSPWSRVEGAGPRPERCGRPR